MGWSPGGKSYADVIAKAVAGATVAALQTGKGSGKGTGNGSGKGGLQHGKSQPSPLKWRCLWKDCDSNKSLNRAHGQANFAHKTECHWCDRPKHRALNPKQTMAVAPNVLAHAAGNSPLVPAPSPAAPGSQRGRAAGAGPLQHAHAATDTSGKTALSVAAPSEACAHATDSLASAVVAPECVDKDLLEQILDLQPALAPIFQLLAAESSPKDAPTSKSPADIVDELLGSSRPASISAEITSCEQVLNTHLRARALYADLPEHAANIDALIASKQAELERLRQKAPSADGLALSLAKARAAFDADSQAKRDSVAMYAAKAAARQAQRAEYMDKILKQHAIACNAIQRAESSFAQLHLQRKEARETQAAAVLREFDARIEAAKPAVPPPLAPSHAHSQSDTAMIGSNALEMAELLTLRQKIQTLQAQANALEKREADFARIVADVPAVEQLPTLDTSNVPLMTACSNLLNLMEHWQRAGACAPFSFGEIEATGCSSAVSRLIKDIFGDTFALWFGAGPPPSSTIVPLQACRLMLEALERVKTSYQTSDRVLASPDSAAVKRFTEWAQAMANKRGRTGSA